MWAVARPSQRVFGGGGRMSALLLQKNPAEEMESTGVQRKADALLYAFYTLFVGDKNNSSLVVIWRFCFSTALQLKRQE